jgi:hypothetical protein
MCFGYCVERYLYAYYRLLCGFRSVRYPTYCHNDRALRRHIHYIPPQYVMGKQACAFLLNVSHYRTHLMGLLARSYSLLIVLVVLSSYYQDSSLPSVVVLSN